MGKLSRITGALIAGLATTILAVVLASAASAAGSCPNEALREQQHSTFLPNCRAYELVSPPQKDGADVTPDPGRTRAAADGDAITFLSRTGFGDVHGTGVATEYIAERSSETQPGDNGWRTHGINPPQAPMTAWASSQGFEDFYVGDFSADLAHAVFRSWSPLTEAPDVAEVMNLYVRDDLRGSGAGTYQLVTPCPACEGSPLPAPPPNASLLPRFVEASADYSHILFASRYHLTADAPEGGPGLYEWVDGQLRYEGILPDGTRTPAIAGTGGEFEPPARIIRGAISEDGSRVFFTVPETGGIYERDDHGTASTGDDTTVQLNSSERTDCADHDPCSGTPEPEAGSPFPATFMTASADGHRAFFTTSEQLINDDHDGNNDLYMYDSDAIAGHHLSRLAENVAAVLGTSRDGHYVYYAASPQAAAGPSKFSNGDGVFVWHDGVTRYIAEIDASDVGIDVTAGNIPGFFEEQARVSGDGNGLLWSSRLALTGVDQSACEGPSNANPCPEMFVYRYDTNHIACASCLPSGGPATGPAQINASAGTSSLPATQETHLQSALSENGTYAFFTTRQALVPGDVNGREDAYEYDTQTGQVHLLSSGTSPTASYFMEASADGRDAFIATHQPLVGWDQDSSSDLYDVRIDGGFPEPPASRECKGDSCQGSLGLPSPPSTLASRSATSGNVIPVSPAATAHPTRAQLLAKALKQCRLKHKARPRRVCERSARRRYAVTSTARRTK